MSRRFDLLRSVAQMNKTCCRCCSNAHCLKYWNVPFLFTGLVQVRNQKSQASVHKVFHFPCFIECDLAKYKIGDISFTSLIIWSKDILSSDDLGHEELLQHPFHDGHPLSQQLWVLFTFQSLLSPLKEEHFLLVLTDFWVTRDGYYGLIFWDLSPAYKMRLHWPDLQETIWLYWS